MQAACGPLPLYVLRRHQPALYCGCQRQQSFGGLTHECGGRLPVTYRGARQRGFKAATSAIPRALGRRARLDVTLRCRQPMTPAASCVLSHHADRSEARPSQSLVIGMPSTSALRADLPVRARASPALLDRGHRLVAGRLRTILGHNAVIAGAFQAAFVGKKGGGGGGGGGVGGGGGGARSRRLPPRPAAGHVLGHDQIVGSC